MPDRNNVAAPSPPRWTGPSTLICLGLAAANVAVYASVRGHEFVRWDDPQYVYENPHVAAGLTWEGIRWAFTTFDASNWHPLTWLSHMLDVQLYGMDAGSHHLTNLLLHIASTLLLYDVLRLMTNAPGRSAFVAALFAVHPMHVESVAWAAERKDVLSTLFWMLTLRAYCTYVRDPAPRRGFTVLACYAAGLMSKPMLVTLPFTLLLLDYWPLGRMNRPGGDAVPQGASSSLSQRVREKLPLFALAALSCVVTLFAQRGAVVGVDALPIGDRVANAFVSYVAYVGKALWPTDLAALYPFPVSLPAWRPIAAAAIVAAVSWVAVREFRRRPYLPVGWFWYLGTLTPVIGLVQVGRQSMADRYSYIPLVGLFLVVAWGVPDLLSRWRNGRIATAAAAAAVIALCALCARRQVEHWTNTRELWEHTLACTKDNELAHNNLGALLIDTGHVDESVVHFSEALRIAPDFADAHNNLGHALRRQGRIDEAIVHFHEALRLKPDCAPAHDNLGLALSQQGKIDESIVHFSEALRITPDYADAHYNLGVALDERGRIDEAIREVSEAVRIEPGNSGWRYDLGVLYQKTGDARCIREFEAVLRLDPTHEAARRALEGLTGR